jgi:hypothetical protein
VRSDSALLLTVVLATAGCGDDAAGSPPATVVAESAVPAPPIDATTRNDPTPADASGEAPPGGVLPSGACVGSGGTSVRTLIVGNSQIYFQNLPKLLTVLSESGPFACPRIAAEGFTHGGHNLYKLWSWGDELGRDLATTIRDGGYDVVVIAESIDLVELPPPRTQFVTYANAIIDAARASGARPVLYATPYAEREDRWGFEEMAAPQIELGRARDVPVAAGGLAWLRVWQAMPQVRLHHPDHAHPGYKGSIISAMVLYAVITGASPIGLTRSPPVDCDMPRPTGSSACPPLTSLEAGLFQRAAWEVALSMRSPGGQSTVD